LGSLGRSPCGPWPARFFRLFGSGVFELLAFLIGWRALEAKCPAGKPAFA